jgi:hypothetical protein
MATGFNIHDQWLGDVMPQSGVSVALGRNTSDGQPAVPVIEVNAKLAILHDTLGSGVVSYNADELRLELTPTGPTPSGTQSIVTAVCFDGYDNTGGTTVDGTSRTVTVDTERYNSHPEIFVLSAANELQINAAGVYEFEYRVSINQTSGSTRQASRAALQKLTPGGAFSEIAGSFSWQYNRQASVGEGTSNARLILDDVVVGDKFRVRAQADGVAATGVVTIAGGSSLTVRKLA